MGISRLLVCALFACAGAGLAELADSLPPDPNHPAIHYFSATGNDPVGILNEGLKTARIELKFEGPQGYLRSVLNALHVPIESQIVVFSKTSLQSPLIEPRNPRAIFFNDSVAVAWMKGGFIEIASQDPQQGMIFYKLEQRPVSSPRFERQNTCLGCHKTDASFGVVGMITRSTYTSSDGSPRLIFGGGNPDHRTPLEERWGGWYVTGSVGKTRHLGNAMVEDDPEAMVTPATLNVGTLKGKFATDGYLSPYSDVAAMMVFDHQMHISIIRCI